MIVIIVIIIIIINNTRQAANRGPDGADGAIHPDQAHTHTQTHTHTHTHTHHSHYVLFTPARAAPRGRVSPLRTKAPFP